MPSQQMENLAVVAGSGGMLLFVWLLLGEVLILPVMLVTGVVIAGNLFILGRARQQTFSPPFDPSESPH